MLPTIDGLRQIPAGEIVNGCPFSSLINRNTTNVFNIRFDGY